MRICCFCEIWGTGGIESFLLNVLENMDRTGLEIDIIVEKKTSELYMSRVEAMGLGFWILSGSTRKVAKNLALFKEIINKHKYDIIHLNIFQAVSMIFAHAAKRAGVPVRIAHAHGSGLRPSITHHLKILLHIISKTMLSRGITDFWACSGKAADFMFPKGVNYKWIPNGINIGQFNFKPEIREKVRLELGLKECFVIGNVGRLNSEKNQGFLLDILACLREKCPEATLLLVGEGEEKDHLEEKAMKLGLSDKVIFFGTSENVPHLLWAMDVFVLPSFAEGFGIVAVEAQAAGLPVLCSTGVPREAGPTGLAQFLSLNAGAEFWAEYILKSRGTARMETSETLKRFGYEIKATVEIIRALYKTGESA